jgi:DNA-binding GntR family transcriptional regulator
MKQAIFEGLLKPGDRVVEAKLASSLKIGHPTVREALIELEHAGFVTRIPNRGTFITKLSKNQVMEIYCIRENLEALALRLARSRITPAGLAIVERHLRAMQEAAVSADRGAFYESDLAFHCAIWEISGNGHLANILESLTAPFLAASITTSSMAGKFTRVVADWHRQIAECLTQGTDKQAEEVVHRAFDFFRIDYRKRNVTETQRLGTNGQAVPTRPTGRPGPGLEIGGIKPPLL